jgi:hypothetical protein
MAQTVSTFRGGRRKSSLGKRKSGRKSIRRKSIRRKSIRRKSIRRKSIRRNSIRRKSIRRNSIRRKNIRRKRRQSGGGNTQSGIAAANEIAKNLKTLRGVVKNKETIHKHTAASLLPRPPLTNTHEENTVSNTVSNNAAINAFNQADKADKADKANEDILVKKNVITTIIKLINARISELDKVIEYAKSDTTNTREPRFNNFLNEINKEIARHKRRLVLYNEQYKT